MTTPTIHDAADAINAMREERAQEIMRRVPKFTLKLNEAARAGNARLVLHYEKALHDWLAELRRMNK